jgi:hypothetical protein
MPTPAPVGATVNAEGPFLERNTEELSLIWNNTRAASRTVVEAAVITTKAATIITAPTNEPNSRQAMVQQHRQSTLPRSAWSRVMLSVVAGTMAPNERNVKRRHQQQQQHQASFLATARDWHGKCSQRQHHDCQHECEYAFYQSRKRSVHGFVRYFLRCSLHGEKGKAGASQVHAEIVVVP